MSYGWLFENPDDEISEEIYLQTYPDIAKWIIVFLICIVNIFIMLVLSLISTILLLQIPSHLKERNEMTNDASITFNKFDSNGDGFIDKSEFTSAMKELGDISESEIYTLFSSIDTDNDGKISFDEFKSKMPL